jgi:hypothetical protein
MRKPERIPLYNPLKKTFSIEWVNEKDEKVILTIPPREIAYFNPAEARYVRKHLADEVYNSRPKIPNSELQYQEIYNEIDVKL